MKNPHFSLVDRKMPLLIAVEHGRLEVAMFLLQKMGKSAENLDNQKMIFESLGKCLKPSS